MARLPTSVHGTFKRPFKLHAGTHPSWLRWIQEKRSSLLETVEIPEGKRLAATRSQTVHRGRDVVIEVMLAFVDAK